MEVRHEGRVWRIPLLFAEWLAATYGLEIHEDAGAAAAAAAGVPRFVYLPELMQTTCEAARDYLTQTDAGSAEELMLTTLLETADSRVRNLAQSWELIGEFAAYWTVKQEARWELVHGYFGGHQGIDQLWVMRGAEDLVGRIIVVEAKGGSGSLSKKDAYLTRENVFSTSGVPMALTTGESSSQMSQNWIFIGADTNILGGSFTAYMLDGDVTRFADLSAAEVAAVLLCLHYVTRDGYFGLATTNLRARVLALYAHLGYSAQHPPAIGCVVISNSEVTDLRLG